jgi:hypothetical protein
MRKAMLLLAIAVLGFPALIQTALMETELSYKPRNARGIHSSPISGEPARSTWPTGTWCTATRSFLVWGAVA